MAEFGTGMMSYWIFMSCPVYPCKMKTDQKNGGDHEDGRVFIGGNDCLIAGDGA
jgi:hypothetical protein